jgi:hypothetical protein
MQDRPAPSDVSRLVGAWRLVSLDNPGGPPPRPDARAADGLIVYDQGGYMSAQIVSPNVEPGSLEPVAFHSYFGTYTVDEAAATVTHHRIANNAAGAPVDVVRAYRFVSDDEVVLAIRGHEGTELTFRRAKR